MDKKKLPERYVYPAVFTYYGPVKEIAVEFPDLGCATSGENDADALLSARDLLGGRLALMEEMDFEIPAPSPLSSIHTEENETTALIDVYMPSIRMAENNKSVNRTVTLPAWLNAVALERNVNFSQVLQEALKSMLNLETV